MGVCAVYGCNTNSRHAKRSKLKLFRFPRNKEQVKKWVWACKRADKFCIEVARVCSLHFKTTDYVSREDWKKKACIRDPNKTRALHPWAVPTLKLPQSIKMDKESRRVRRANFSESEVRALVCAVAKRWSVLFGPHSLEDQQQSPSQRVPRKDAWIEVTREVNKVSEIQRSILDIKKKMTALKYLIRKQPGDGKRKEPMLTSTSGLVSVTLVEPRPWEKILRELMDHNTCEESDLQKLETEFDISMVIPGCSDRQDVTDFQSKPSRSIKGDVGGLSRNPNSATWIKEEKPLTDTDSDSRTETDSGGMLSDEDQVRETKRRRLKVFSRTAQAIVDIQRNLNFSVDRLDKHLSGISSMDQHLGGVTNSIQELVAITHRLGSVVGQNIQSNQHRGWDNNITNNYKSLPSLPSHSHNNHSHTHTDDHLSTHIHMQEAILTDNRNGVQDVSSSLSAGVAQQETNQSAFTNQDDEEELFGRYIGATIRTLTERSKSRAKLKIQQVIFSLQEADGRNIISS